MRRRQRSEIVDGQVADYVRAKLAAWRPGMAITLTSFDGGGDPVNWRLVRCEELDDGRMRLWLLQLSDGATADPIRWQKEAAPKAKPEPTMAEIMKSVRVSSA